MILYYYACTIFFTVTCKSLPLDREYATNVGTVLFSASDIHKKQWGKSEIGLLQARRYFQNLLPPPIFINTFNEDHVNNLLRYFKDAYAAIKKEAKDSEADTIMTTALSDAIGGYLKVWVLPVAKLDYYGGTISQEHVVRLFQFYNEIKRYLDTNGDGWRNPDEKTLNSMTINVAPLQLFSNTRNIKDPCDHLAYFEKTPTGLSIPTPNVNWNDRSSTMFVPLKNVSIISMTTPDTSHNLIKYYDAARNCITISNPKQQEHFDEKFQKWLIDDVVPHLKDENLYLALGSVLTLINRTQDLCNSLLDLHVINHTQKKKSKFSIPCDISSKKMWIITLILLIEIAWCVPALIFVLCFKRFNKKDCSSNVYLFIDNDKKDKGKNKGQAKVSSSKDTCWSCLENTPDGTQIKRKTVYSNIDFKYPSSQERTAVGTGTEPCRKYSPNTCLEDRACATIETITPVMCDISKKSSLKKIYSTQFCNSTQMLTLTSHENYGSKQSEATCLTISSRCFPPVADVPTRNKKRRDKDEYKGCEECKRSENRKSYERIQSGYSINIEELTQSEECRKLKKLAEKCRKQQERRQAEEYRKLQEQRQAEENRKLQEQREAEDCRILEERRQGEECRKLEERRQAEECGKLEEQRQAEECRKLQDRRKAGECIKPQEQRQAEKCRQLEELRLPDECRKPEERRQAEECGKLEERRLAEECWKLQEWIQAEECRKLEERRKAGECMKPQEQRQAEKCRQLEELRLPDECRKPEERRQAEECGKLEERRLAEECWKLQEWIQAEECRKLEERRKAGECMKPQEQRQAEECRKLEERRLAEEYRIFEEHTQAEECKKLEERCQSEECRKLEDRQKLEESRKLDENREHYVTEVDECKCCTNAEFCKYLEEKNKLDECRKLEELRKLQTLEEVDECSVIVTCLDNDDESREYEECTGDEECREFDESKKDSCLFNEDCKACYDYDDPMCCSQTDSQGPPNCEICPCTECLKQSPIGSNLTCCGISLSNMQSPSDKQVVTMTTHFKVKKELQIKEGKEDSKRYCGKPYLEITVDRPGTEICVDMSQCRTHSFPYRPSKIPKPATCSIIQPASGRQSTYLSPVDKHKSLIPQLKKKIADDLDLASCHCSKSSESKLNGSF